VSKQHQTIFLPNAQFDQQKKLRAKKISMMPYISVWPSNCSAEEMLSKQNLNDSKCFCEILNWIHMLCIYFRLTLELLHKRNVEQTKSKWFQMLLWNPRSNPRKKFQANKKTSVDSSWKVYNSLPAVSH
jgi:hypothetical protein